MCFSSRYEVLSEPETKKFVTVFDVILGLQIIAYVLGVGAMYVNINTQDGFVVDAIEPLALSWLVLSAAVVVGLPFLILFVQDKKKLFTSVTIALLVLFGIQLAVIKPIGDWIDDKSIHTLRP